MKKTPLSYVEISKKNLIHNIKEFRNFLNINTKIVGVIKSNAYGHGDLEVVKILNSYVDYFQVNSILELKSIRKITKKPILLFGYIQKDDIADAILEGCILTAFDLAHLLLINQKARELKTIQKVHIAIDSLLGREGIMPNDISNYIIEIKKMNNVVIDGLYSHFSNIEDIRPDQLPFGRAMNSTHSEKQIETYRKAVDLFENNGFSKIKTHISATSGILVYEKNKKLHNIVRLGIGLYGMWPSEHLAYLYKKKLDLRPVLRWVTHIAQIKTLPPNHPIGYGLTYITKKKTIIAVIPQGYADGFSRQNSNTGEVLIKGKKVKILGRVAMNMIVVDISRVKGVETEDEVIILGNQEKQTISADNIAQRINTINYEITTNISPLLPRIIV